MTRWLVLAVTAGLLSSAPAAAREPTLRGAASSQRHWHEKEDEFVYVLQGEVVLREDGGETVLKPGDAAAWKAGVENGHCLINKSSRDAVFIEVGTRVAAERAFYSDIDMMVTRDDKGARYTKKNGEPY